MWKRAISTLILLVIAFGLGFLATREKGKIQKPDESVIDSLESLRASYESITDSLLIERSRNDSLSKAKVKEVVRYKFKESIKYLKEATNLEKEPETQVLGDTDSVAVLRLEELQKINGNLAEIPGLKARIAIDDSIIRVQTLNIRTADTLIVLKDKEIKYLETKSKRDKRKHLGIGAGVGAVLTSILWILL